MIYDDLFEMYGMGESNAKILVSKLAECGVYIGEPVKRKTPYLWNTPVDMSVLDIKLSDTDLYLLSDVVVGEKTLNTLSDLFYMTPCETFGTDLIYRNMCNLIIPGMRNFGITLKGF